MVGTLSDDLYKYFLSTDIGDRCICVSVDMIPNIMIIDKNHYLYNQLGIREVHWISKTEYIVYADLRLCYTFRYLLFDGLHNVTVILKWKGPSLSGYDVNNLCIQSDNMIVRVKLGSNYYFSWNDSIGINTIESLQSFFDCGAKFRATNINLYMLLYQDDISFEFIIKFLVLLNKLVEKNGLIKVPYINIKVNESFLQKFSMLDMDALEFKYNTLKKHTFENVTFYKTNKIYFHNVELNIKSCTYTKNIDIFENFVRKLVGYGV